MNTGMAVLLALVLIAVVLLIVWLVLRSRSSQSATAAPSAGDRVRPGSDERAQPAAPAGSSGVAAGVGAAAGVDPGEPDEVEETGAGLLGSGQAGPSDGADLAEEYVDPGLSDLGDTAAEEEDAARDETAGADADAHSDAGEPAGDAPRTPAEAFGGSDGEGPELTDALGAETSVLDQTDVDSTPLFRSMREERLGAVSTSPAGQETVGQETVGQENAGQENAEKLSEEPAVFDEQAPAEQPVLSWSDERRGWDEQAHDVDATAAEEPLSTAPDEPLSGVADSGDATVYADDHDLQAGTDPGAPTDPDTRTEGAADADAPGAADGGPTAEEDHHVNTDQETVTEARGEAAPTGGEQPPLRRISELHEVVDGGFGIGSAAPIADGAQPLGHPIKASVNTKTYQDLHSPWYDSAEPDVWFLDAGFAERAGFHRAE